MKALILRFTLTACLALCALSAFGQTAACASGTMADYVALGSTGCTLSTAGYTAHAIATTIKLSNFAYTASATGTTTTKAASAIAVSPNPGTVASGVYAGLRFLAGQTNGTDPGDFAATAGGTLSATISFTVTVASFPTHGILGQMSMGGGLALRSGSTFNMRQLLCFGAAFGSGHSCAGFLNFDDKFGVTWIVNLGFTQTDHQGLKDTTPNPSTGAPLYAPSQGVGLIDVVAQFSVDGASGGNVGISSYVFLGRPTD